MLTLFRQMPALIRRRKRSLTVDPESEEELDGVGNEAGILAQRARRREEAQAREHARLEADAQSNDQVCR